MKFVTIVVLGLILSACSLLPDVKPAESEPVAEKNTDAVHLHAGFKVYDDGQLMDFSGLQYMHLAPCMEGDQDLEATPEHEQEEKAHLHNSIGDVVHVHRAGVLWKDLFVNLKYDLGTEVTGYVNGQAVTDILNYPIQAYDSVIIVAGVTPDIEVLLSSQVTREEIETAESQSENCGS